MYLLPMLLPFCKISNALRAGKHSKEYLPLLDCEHEAIRFQFQIKTDWGLKDSDLI